MKKAAVCIIMLSINNTMMYTGRIINYLCIFMQNKNIALSRDRIFERVWNQAYFVEDKTINVHISNIRAKLRPTGTDGYIKTVWGIGFKLE